MTAFISDIFPLLIKFSPLHSVLVCSEWPICGDAQFLMEFDDRFYFDDDDDDDGSADYFATLEKMLKTKPKNQNLIFIFLLFSFEFFE